MAEKELEKRLTQLEDIEAIRQLKARYCLYVDQRNERGRVSLFTEDAVWESDKFGIHEGREAIRTLFRGIPSFLNFHAPLRDEPNHRGRRKPRDRKLVASGAVHFRPGQPASLGRRTLRGTVPQSWRGVEIEATKARILILESTRARMG